MWSLASEIVLYVLVRILVEFLADSLLGGRCYAVLEVDEVHQGEAPVLCQRLLEVSTSLPY